MEDRAQCQAGSSLPSALIGAAVLIAVIELWLGRLGLHLTHLETANHHFPRTVLHDAARAEVLCFGDSLVKQGIVPTVLEQKLGKSAYNLGISGGTPVATYCVFRQALEAGARPQAVLVDFDPVMISIGANHSARLLAETASARDCLDAGWHYRSTDYFAALALAWSLPSVRYRKEVRGLVAVSLTGRPLPAGDSVSEAWNNWRFERGAQLNPSVQVERGRSALWNPRYATHMPRKCDWRSAYYIERFLALAEANRLPVYWILPPVHPEIRASWDAGGATEFYTRFVQAMEERFTGLTVIDARCSGSPAERFYDACHLDATGARAFTAQVADALNQHPSRAGAPGRWVNVSAERIEMIARSPVPAGRAR